jgi:outer membrane protein assembly factor BamB
VKSINKKTASAQVMRAVSCIRGVTAVAAVFAVVGVTTALPAAAATSRQWTGSYSDPNDDVTGWAAATNPSGSAVFATGSAFFAGGPGSGYGETIGYNAATGAVLWQAQFSPPSDANYTHLSAIAVSPSGATVFVTGYTNTNSGDTGVVLAYSAATGALLWQQAGPYADGINGKSPVKVSSDGATVYVTGGTAGTEAYNASTGAVKWSKPQGGAAIALSASGSRLYVTGEAGSSSSSTATPVTRALNAATGATVWTANEGADATLTAAKFTPHGNVLFVGGFITAGAVGSTEKGTLKAVAYNAATGAKLWQVSTGSETVSDYAQAAVTGLDATPSGSALIVSEFLDSGSWHWETLALNPATGAITWRKSEGASTETDSMSAGLGLSPDGSTAYVTGSTAAGGTTVGYNTATGAQTFTATDRLVVWNAISVSSTGSQLFVTGSKTADENIMTTVAYGTS